MKKSCRWCGKIVPRGHDCPKKPKQQSRREKWESGRYTNDWNVKSIEIKEASKYLCAVCLEGGRYTYDGLEVHHIVPLRERPELLLEDANLICLCERHHTQAERGEIDRWHLMELAAQRDTPVGWGG